MNLLNIMGYRERNQIGLPLARYSHIDYHFYECLYELKIDFILSNWIALDIYRKKHCIHIYSICHQSKWFLLEIR